MSTREDSSLVVQMHNVMAALTIAVQVPGKEGTLGVPVILWGPPGVGKTTRLGTVADVLGFDLVTILAGLRGPEDFLGIPAPDPRTHVMDNYPPRWAIRLRDNNPNDWPFYGADEQAIRHRARYAAQVGTGQKLGTAGGGAPASAPAVPQGFAPPPSFVAKSPLAPPVAPPVAPANRSAELAPIPPADPITGRVPGVVPSLLFLDEFTTARASTTAALLRVVDERVVGDVVLPSTTTIVAAANPPSQAAGDNPNPLKPPSANRFIHLDFPQPNLIEWGGWIRATASRAAKNAQRGDAGAAAAAADLALRTFVGRFQLNFAAWAEQFVHAADLAAQVMQDAAGVERTRRLLNNPPADDDDGGRAWPSPRSWEFGLRAYAGAISVGASSAAETLLIGAVGETAARIFLDSVDIHGLPAPELILTEAARGKFIWRPDKTVQTLRVVQGINRIAAYAINLPENDPRRAGVWPFFRFMHDEYGESAILPGTDMLYKDKFRLADKDAQWLMAQRQHIVAAAARAATQHGKATSFLAAGV